MSKIYVIAEEVLESKFKMIFDRFDEMKKELSLYRSEDKLIRIGEVKSILTSKEHKCKDNRTAQRWLDENDIRTQYKEGSTHKYYSKNDVLKSLNHF